MDKKMLTKKLIDLTNIPSVSGNEAGCALWLKQELKNYADKISVDIVGNVIAVKGKPKVYIFAHMDKVGYIVSTIKKNFVEVVPIKKGKALPKASGWSVVIANGTGLKGVLKQSATGELRIKNTQVDKVSVGDFVSLAPNFKLLGQNLIRSQGLDNKLGVLVAIEVFKRSQDIGFIATVQEECTKLGAKFAVTKTKPKRVIVLDVTYDEGKSIRISQGPSICLKDELFPDQGIANKLKQIAKKYKIKHQLEVLDGGGSDAGAIYDARGYTPFCFLGIPIKNMHTPNETADMEDVGMAITLLTHFLEETKYGS